LLERSRDIQSYHALSCALVHTDGFNGLDNGLTLIKELLQRYWDDVYPRQDPDDEIIHCYGMNTLSTLNDYKKFLDPLINIPLTNSKLGHYSWNQIETSKNKVDALSHMTHDGYLKKGFDKDSPDTLEEAEKKAADELASIEAAFKDTLF